MREQFPDGFEKRFPGRKKDAIQRIALTALGPWHEISCDGHEKLNSQALQMGDISFPIYAYKDKFTSNAFDIRVVPNARNAGTIGHLTLDLVEKEGCKKRHTLYWSILDPISGIPLQFLTDKGVEVHWIYVIMSVLR
jgi:hypothetical protein